MIITAPILLSLELAPTASRTLRPSREEEILGRFRQEKGREMEDTDKETSQLREQAENGITLCSACFTVSAPAEAQIIIVCSLVKLKCTRTFYQ